MQKEIINVPSGVQFISQWTDYKLPKGNHCIVDKGVTGCGYTEFCLTNEDNVVLCSPRKLLLENKSEQHKNDLNILYLENNIEKFQNVIEVEQEMTDHILKCKFNHKPVKFMVTYDSLHYISEYLLKHGEENQYVFVVDEFQSIFLDSYFKAEVENNFVEYLQDCTNVIYLSATPMMEKYLKRLDEFKDLKFYEINWSESGYVDKIKFQRKHVKSLTGECNRIIQDYLKGNYPILVNSDKSISQSTEAVFYFNSVSDIIRCVNKNKLTPENTIIVCANTEDNRKKLRKIKFNFGKIPLNGEKHPMFMFCTSSVYMGVDFYSTCASSFVFADPNLRCLALDISMDLPQIVGRQRNKSNQFKNNIVIFYKTLRKDEVYTKDDFDKLQKEREKQTYDMIDVYTSVNESKQKGLKTKFLSDIKVSKYAEDYVSFSKKTGLPVYNKLIEVANERAWEVSQKDYQDSINVTRAIKNAGFDQEVYKDRDNTIIDEFLNNFNSLVNFEERMKAYCEFRDKNLGNKNLENRLHYKITSNYGDDNKFENYYNFYGTSGCKARSYKEANLKTGISDKSKDIILIKEIFSIFSVGDKLAKNQIKETLGIIYTKLKIKSTPKASDLEQYFNLRAIKVKDSSGKWVNGFEIVKKK